MRGSIAIVLLCAVSANAGANEPLLVASRAARSIGSPVDGRLENARRLRESDSLRYLVVAAMRGRQWGTEELVGLLHRAAEAVSRAFPGSVMRVADLSARRGGEVHMHASHESGRDADIAFYLRDPEGVDALPESFVRIGPDGRTEDGSFVFDDERNWRLIEAMLRDRRASVTHIFVAAALKQLLISRGRASGAPAAIIARAEQVLSQPRGSLAHDNHFHVRVACAADDKPECLEGTRRRP